MARVVLERLSKAFAGPGGRSIRALEALSLTVESGELLTLVGPSGCGKTTTLRLVAGLEAPDSGTISIGGQIVNAVPPKDREVAMVFQNHALYPHLTSRENLAFGLTLRRRPKAEIEQRVGEAVEMLGLGDCLNRKPPELSGGQRQRVALGRALVRRPKVLLLDEPLSDLDAPMRLQMRAELAKLHRRLGGTWIYVTHDQTEAMTLGDRLAVMQAGALRQADAPLELYRHPVDRFVAGFIGSPPMNFFHGQIEARNGGLLFLQATATGPAFELPLSPQTAGQLDGLLGKAIILGLRPEHIRAAAPQKVDPSLLTSAPTSQRSSDTVSNDPVPAKIEVIEQVGAETVLHLTRGTTGFVARLPATAGLQVGQTIRVWFDMDQAHFFDPETRIRLNRP